MGSMKDYMKTVISEFFEYDTPKIVHIKSYKIGIINRVFQVAILSYIIGFAIVYKKGYQEVGDVHSVVTTKVKGTVYTNLSSTALRVPSNYTELYQRIWDPTDYVIPASGGDQGGFFITTNVVITPNQTRGVCAEDPKISRCSSDSDCPAGTSLEIGNGVVTGKCVDSRIHGNKSCEIHAWCPVEDDQLPLNGTRALLEGSKNFTVLIKNTVQFPKFGKQYRRRNILEDSTQSYLQSCNYSPADPFCPIFKIGDIVANAGENYTEVAIRGGVFQITIIWECNLDFDFMEYCTPKYQFQRMDNPNALISPGWNFRTAEYSEENRRTLSKNYGIKFLISVEGQARKFNFVPLMINLGSGLALLGVATIFCDILVLKCLKYKEYYHEKKYLVIRNPHIPHPPDSENQSNAQYSQFDYAHSSSRSAAEGSSGSGGGNIIMYTGE